MTSKASRKKKTSQRPRAPRTSIVPRVVFQTMVAVAVVPSASVIAGCGPGSPTVDSGARDSGFSVAAPRDGGGDANDVGFSVVDVGPQDSGFFSVVDVGPQDAGFSVAAPLDGGAFSVAAPLDDGGTFSVAAPPGDSGTA